MASLTQTRLRHKCFIFILLPDVSVIILPQEAQAKPQCVSLTQEEAVQVPIPQTVSHHVQWTINLLIRVKQLKITIILRICNHHSHKKEKKKDKEREKERDRDRREDRDRSRDERERSTSKKKKSKDKERDRDRKSDSEKGDVKVCSDTFLLSGTD